MPNSDARPGSGRSAKDRTIIALLIAAIVALLCGVAFGAHYLMRMYADNSAAVEEAASRAVPTTPEDLKAAGDASAASDASEGLSGADVRAAGSDTAGTGSGTAGADSDAAAQDDASRGEQDVRASTASQPEDEPGAQASDAPAQAGPAADGASPSDSASSSAGASTSGDTSAAVDPNLPDNPIDFTALQKENADIYAWLYIPNTGINLPVLQNPFDDSYYLNHDAHREENLLGAVYSQIANKKDFSDPVTVLYGHDGEAQFKNLHYFEDEKFFDENDKMYVYTAGHIYTYRIVSAYKSDNRHILNTHDFTKQDVLQSYFDSVLNPDSLLLNVREGVTLDATKDKIVQLSTCMLDEFHGSSRYIVTGVLIDDQPTK